MDIIQIIKTAKSEIVNAILYCIGEYKGKLSDSVVNDTEGENWQHYGFASRPHDANDNGCAEGISVNDSGTNRIIADRDKRYGKVFGELDKGDAILYSGVKDKKACGCIKMQGKNGGMAIYVIRCLANWIRGMQYCTLA